MKSCNAIDRLEAAVHRSEHYHESSTDTSREDNRRIGVQPPKKEPPPLMISDRVEGLRTDAEVRRFVNNVTRKDEVAVIEFGASWCHHCHQVFPAFYALTKKFPSMRYAVAHIDTLVEEGKHLQRTPTFSFYKNGKRIDELYGTNMEALGDRLWLHQDDSNP